MTANEEIIWVKKSHMIFKLIGLVKSGIEKLRNTQIVYKDWIHIVVITTV